MLIASETEMKDRSPFLYFILFNENFHHNGNLQFREVSPGLH